MASRPLTAHAVRQLISHNTDIRKWRLNAKLRLCVIEILVFRTLIAHVLASPMHLNDCDVFHDFVTPRATRILLSFESDNLRFTIRLEID